MMPPARMMPKREAELREFATERPYVMTGILVEALDALAAERAHEQQVEVPHSSAAVVGYLLLVRGEDTTFVVGAAPFDEPFPTLQAAQDEAAGYRNMTVSVMAGVLVGADGRIGS